jgi:hypothetical protein
MIPCRDCAREASPDALTCPHCGAPRPARPEWNGEGYEWKSQGTWRGLPVVHIAFGIDCAGRLRVARGVVAIGVVAIGILAFGVVALAAALACGVNAAAPFAIGVVAAGYAAGGVQTISWKILFSVTKGLL